MMSPALQTLSPNVQNSLSSVVKPKFDAYFEFTTGCVRAIPSTGMMADGMPEYYTYPNTSMIPDLTVLWSLYCEVYEIFGRSTVNIPKFFSANPTLQEQIVQIIKDGQFWDSPHGSRSLREVPPIDAVPSHLPTIWKTLRNGYAHFHWCYENLSAAVYWERMGWNTDKHQEIFKLRSRMPTNYIAYIADAAPPWKSANFWNLDGLRIIVTPYTTLRYRLHLFLNILLNGDSRDVFGNHK